ncbi:flagellar hook-basal body complex protein FliE [Candidatus Bathyarchaeota archaeon]|nr:flagellar hook-basal body complex protein FliE [Candidatus Bathyarchaeota archaeon]
MNRRKLILITGMAGSGKTTLSKIVKESGFKVLTMGDVIRELAKQQGVDPTPENIGRLASDIRKEGQDAVARRCIELLKKGYANELVFIDGIRSLDEVNAFKEVFDVMLVAIHASPVSRYKRLTRRGRSDDPKSWEEFKEREERELGFGIGNSIASADFMIINDDGIDQLDKSFNELIKKVKENE